MKSAALGPRHERNSAIVIAVWHGVRHEKRSAKLQLVIAPFCAMCLDAGIVRPAEIADHIVPHRGDVNSSPTLAQHNLDQTSPLSSSIARTSVPLGTVARAQAQGRKRVGTERELLGLPKAGIRGAPWSRVTHRVMMRQHDRVRPIAHCDIGSQKNAHVVSSAGEGPLV
jgi:hypothetical protein